MEQKFDTNNMRNPKSYQNYVDIRAENDYVFMSNSYTGEGGYKSGDYVLPFSKEQWLEQRKSLASYRNFVKPIINSIVEPVFGQPITRKTNNAIFEDFLLNVDNKNNNINDNSLKVATLSRLHGVTFVVVDNLPETLLPESQDEIISSRAYPYIYIQPAYTVDSYTTDYYGLLATITFKSKTIIEGKSHDKYVTWTSMDTITEIKDGDKSVSVEVHTHALGILPVISVYSVIDDCILPTPPFYDIAKINYNIYNKDSEVRDQERAQAFSIFYIQTDLEVNNMSMGSHNGIRIPAGNDITIPPGYASPDPSILTVLNANTENLIQSIFQIATDNGINVGVRQQTSGVTEAYKFIGKNYQLIRTAKLLEDYERKLAYIFSKYINTEFDYQVNYSKDYSPTVSADNIDNTLKLLSLDISDDIKREIKKKLFSEVLEYLDETELTKLLEKI